MFQKISNLAPVFSVCEKAIKTGFSNPAIQQQIRLKDRLADIFSLPQDVQSITSSEATSIRIRQSMPLPSGITTLSSYPRARERAERPSILGEKSFPITSSQGEI